jgi:hypothetical protein
MKIFRHILSDNGILVTTVFFLMIAAAFACTGIVLEAQDHMAGLPLLAIDADIASYVLAGVMGDVPSTAGTFQSIGFFVAYVVTPLTAVTLFAIKAVVARRGRRITRTRLMSIVSQPY